MTSCTFLWKEHTNHCSSLQHDLENQAEGSKLRIWKLRHLWKPLINREFTISKSMSMALEKMENAKIFNDEPQVDNSDGLFLKIKSRSNKFSTSDVRVFISAQEKKVELLRSELPKGLRDYLDPPRDILEEISKVFLVDKRLVKSDRNNNDNNIN
ncbi:FRIGIDA-like protein 4b [Forsythia ovata]|uniref:FRIGIDA-like protein 4b n=1 Tax=Forsythia ovata TaxID=205694 RepID=A0ABD1WJZ1_9LAMI